MPAKLYKYGIHAGQIGTLSGLFQRRVANTPKAIAYLQYDYAKKKWKRYTWQEMEHLVARWQQALAKESLAPGERVAILLNNSVEWVCFDLASISLQLVVVPLYTSDSTESITYILEDSGARLLLVGRIEQWLPLAVQHNRLRTLQKVLCVNPDSIPITDSSTSVQFVKDWLDKGTPTLVDYAASRDSLATIVYTSGTTGRPKGVMLSHHNILWNARAVLKAIPSDRKDRYLSFLPLSHTFERTAGYYVPMIVGSRVAFARSAKDLPEDLVTQRPTVLISVPRIFERFYAEVQRRLKEKSVLARALFKWTETLGWRRFEAAQGIGKDVNFLQRFLWAILKRLVADRILARLGGRLRLAVSGGAPLPEKISHCFLGLGLPLIQGYGLTEAAPVVSVNRPDNNIPDSVGERLPGIEVNIGKEDELLVRAPSVMLGYWNRPEDTRQVIDDGGWLHTGDQVQIVDDHIFIRGRLKDILVMSTGEKVAPADIELTITQDPLFYQVMVVGEAKPFLAALVVLNREGWKNLAKTLTLNPDDPLALGSPRALNAVLTKTHELTRGFPGYAQIRAMYLTLDTWTIENGLITPTMKLKRREIEKHFASQIHELYAGHEPPL